MIVWRRHVMCAETCEQLLKKKEMRLNKWTSMDSSGIEMCINGELLWVRQWTCGFWQMLEMTHKKTISVSNTTLFQSFSRAFRKTAKSSYFLRHVCPSVCPHLTTRLTLDGFLWNLVFEEFVGCLLRKFGIYWKLRRIAGTLREDRCTFVVTCRWIPLRMKNVSDNS